MSYTPYFINFSEVSQIKKEYHRLALINHPDRGGNTEIMQEINAQYQEALAKCDRQTSKGSDNKTHTYYYNQEVEQAIMDKIAEILSLKLDGIEVWLIGTWIWVGGETYPHRKILNEIGLSYNGKRKKWQFHTGSKYRRYSQSSNFADLAATYGAKKFDQEKESTSAKAIA
jgi:hypothetical protein